MGQRLQVKEQESSNMSLETVTAKVFGIEELLDKVLGYVIHTDNGQEISTPDIQSCRLVNKTWLHSITKCLDKCRTPLFHVHLTRVNSRNDTTYVAVNGKLLDNFIDTVTGSSRWDRRIPPFKIKVDPDFFRHENYESLLACFKKCGSSLVDLDIKFPDNGGSMMFVFPNLSFPKLQRFTVKLVNDNFTYTTNLADGERFMVETNYIYLMQHIISGCKELKTLKVDTVYRNIPYYCVEQLCLLPSTISTLELLTDLKNKNLEYLMRNDLPNLKKLELTGIYDTLESAVIYKLLEKFGSNLRHFRSHRNSFKTYRLPRKVTYLRLPVMNKLEVFESDVIGLELDSSVSLIQNKLPRLRKLCLTTQTVGMFRKWTENSNFTSVVELIASLVDENFAAHYTQHYVSFSSEMVLSMNTTFPNLRILEITVYGTSLCGLTCVFQNLKRLQVLRVNAERTGDITTSDPWDAILIGIPVDTATVLRTTRTWSQAPYFNKGIRELTELQELVLENGYLASPLISDAVFQLAFMKMSRLTKLVLTGEFEVSPETKQEWEDKGREIIYCKYRIGLTE